MKSYSDRFIESYNSLDDLEDLEEDLCRECAVTNCCFICSLYDGKSCIYHNVIDRIFDLKLDQLKQEDTKSFHE